MWLSLVERCVRDAETARSNRAIPTTWVLRVCFTANLFHAQCTAQKKESFRMKNSLFGAGKTHRTPASSDCVGNHRLRGQQIRMYASQMHGELV